MSDADSQRIAVVTGGGGALGSATARQLVRDGFRVVVADIDNRAATAVAAALAASASGSAIAHEVDVRDPGSVQSLVQAIAARFGRIDVVVNNAALPSDAGLNEVSILEWDAVMEVNVRGAMLLCREVYPYWERSRSGSIVNVSSRTWMSGGPPAYVTSKAALVGLTRALAVELAPINVTVNAVAPSFVPTPFTQRGRSTEENDAAEERMRRLSRLGRLCSAEDVARTISFLVSPAAAYITGEVVHVSGGAQLAPLR
jgi:NAD(P)-dependent dehydrogenase (short-subunit alcohol dehydrogenase family)